MNEEEIKRRVYELQVLRSRVISQNKIETFYPDDGPLSRGKYGPQMDFFRAGSWARERCTISANGTGKCCSYDTLISMTDGSLKKIGEIKVGDKVTSWQGIGYAEGIVSSVFKKPPETVYRVWTSSGQWFDIAGEHRFLTKSGWFFFSDLQKYVFSLPPTRQGIGLLGSFEDVFHYLKKDVGFQAYCQDHFRLCDERPPRDAEDGQGDVRVLSGVRIHTRLSLNEGVQENKYIEHLSRFFDRPSNIDAGGRALNPHYGFLDPISYTDDLPCLCSHQTYPPLSIVEALVFQSDFSIKQGRSLSFLAFESSYALSNTIICYQEIGVKDIYDIHVPKYHNYLSGGVVHHNTEGIGGYEITCHLTGVYPEWWEGRRFDHPIMAWAAGDTGQTVKDIIQDKLLGPPGDEGTGMIPGKFIDLSDIKKKAGSVADAVEVIRVKHVSGGKSHLTFKSFDQGRRSFQGTERHVIWLDEECPENVYDECLMRTRKVNGMIIFTFTPLSGLTTTVKNFAPAGIIPKDGKASPSKFVNNITWEHAPHLTDEEKEQILSSTLPHLRAARSKGIPHLGSGVIYPIDHAVLEIEDFPIPVWYKRVYGLDYGWNFTAALWAALDPDTDVLNITDCYKRGHAEPPIHAAAILARGDWIPGVSDPSKGTSQRDGKELLSEYNDLLGGMLYPAKNAVEAGLLAVWNRMSTGRLKIFKHKCAPLFDEMRVYHRNEKGDIVKENDHLCLHPATKVITRDGLIDIRDLVGTTGEVLSHNGKWEKYQNCRQYGKNKRLIEVVFDNGDRIKCTWDHKFLTINGWKHAIDLIGNPCYRVVSNTIQGENLCKSIPYQKQGRTLTGLNTIYVETISNATGLDYIELSGNIGTGKFQKVIMSIIKMVIIQTTRLQIYSLNLIRNIFLVIPKEFQNRSRLRLLMLQNDGTVAVLGKNGTRNIIEKSLTNFTENKILNANSVELNTKRKSLEKIDSALINVKRRIDMGRVSMMKPDPAFSAENLSRLTNTQKDETVQSSAVLNPVAITEGGRSDVYCLNVPNTRTFIVENGIISHNCDDLRYICISGIQYAAEMPDEDYDDDRMYASGGGRNPMTGV